MSLLSWNLALAFVWAAVVGDFSLPTLLVGFSLGFGILAIGDRLFGGAQYARRLRGAAGLAAFFAAQLVLSSGRVAADIVTPTHRARPGILAVPLDARSDGEITLLANLVSLTPGSLSLDVSDDRSTLFVHVMFLDDPERCRADIKNGFERRILELTR